MAGDWLRLYRKSLDSRVFSDDWLWRLWCWCLMKANWKTTWKEGRELQPGQFTVGRSEAANQLAVSPSRLYRGLHTLRDWGQIRLEANSRFTVVTVCNWKSYQPEDGADRTAGEQPVNSQRTAGEQPADTPISKGRREEDKDTPPTPPRGKSGEDPPLPFASQNFRITWEEWVEYRRQRREKKYTPLGLRRLFGELASWGEARAIDAIRLSITKGWQGIHEARNGTFSSPSGQLDFSGLQSFVERGKDKDAP